MYSCEVHVKEVILFAHDLFLENSEDDSECF